MLFHQWNDTFIIGAVGVMKVRFVNKNHGLARRFRDEIAQLILRRDAGSGIVRITDVNQTALRGGKHLL